MIHVEQAAGREALERLRPQWCALMERCEHADPFLGPDWVLTWHRHFGDGREVAAWTAWRDGDLVAILPQLRFRERRWGVSVRRLGGLRHVLIGVPRIGMLMEPRPDVARALAQAWARDCRSWETFDLDGMRAGSDIERLVWMALAETGLGARLHILPSREACVIPLRGTWEDYLATRSVNFRRSLRRAWRGVAALADVRRSVLTRPEDVVQGIDHLFLVDRRNRKDLRALNGDPGLECLRAFCVDVGERLASLGQIEVRLLEAGGSLLASTIFLRYKDVLYGLKIGFDRGLPDLSPGRVMLSWLVEDAWRTGIRKLDFLSRWPYLERWAAEIESYTTVRIDSTSAYARSLRSAARLLKPARSLFRRREAAL